MEIATLSAGLGAARAAYQGLKTVLETKSQIAADQRVLDALTKLGSALDAIYDLRDELFRLQDENRALKDAQREHDDWSRKAAAYVLVEAPGGAVVWKSEGPPPHYACPRCFEDRKAYQLQNRQIVTTGEYGCPGCGKSFRVDAPGKLPEIKYPGGGGRGGPHGWMRT
jgi:hypothetical protein